MNDLIKKRLFSDEDRQRMIELEIEGYQLEDKVKENRKEMEALRGMEYLSIHGKMPNHAETNHAETNPGVHQSGNGFSHQPSQDQNKSPLRVKVDQLPKDEGQLTDLLRRHVADHLADDDRKKMTNVDMRIAAYLKGVKQVVKDLPEWHKIRGQSPQGNTTISLKQDELKRKLTEAKNAITAMQVYTPRTSMFKTIIDVTEIDI